MGRVTAIEWTHRTLNGWMRCAKLESKKQASASDSGCAANIAKGCSHRVRGKRAPRRFLSGACWRRPLAWNRAVEAVGERKRVFCPSMADVFEDRRDLDPRREKLPGVVIGATPRLDWLLLTKRPERAAALAPWGADWPANVWLEATVESGFWAAQRLPALAAVPARIRFTSCEPLLGPLDSSGWLGGAVHWVIAGGEIGCKARPSDSAWFRNLRDQCRAADVAFHFKQWCAWTPAEAGVAKVTVVGGTSMAQASTTANGRVLDGRTWDAVPRSVEVL